MTEVPSAPPSKPRWTVRGDFDLEFRLVWPDGTEHWTHGSARVFATTTDRPIRMLGTGQDITDRKTLESERDRLLAEERRAGEFREAFIDVISHELRTPITTILGATEILSRPGRVLDPEVRSAMLADARAESERLYRLVEDLLVLSRVERGRLVVESEPLQPRPPAGTGRDADGLRTSVREHLPRSTPSPAGRVRRGRRTWNRSSETSWRMPPSTRRPARTWSWSGGAGGAEVVIAVLDGGPGIPRSVARPHLRPVLSRPGHGTHGRRAAGSACSCAATSPRPWAVGLVVASGAGGRCAVHLQPAGPRLRTKTTSIAALSVDCNAIARWRREPRRTPVTPSGHPRSHASDG